MATVEIMSGSRQRKGFEAVHFNGDMNPKTLRRLDHVGHEIERGRGRVRIMKALEFLGRVENFLKPFLPAY